MNIPSSDPLGLRSGASLDELRFCAIATPRDNSRGARGPEGYYYIAFCSWNCGEGNLLSDIRRRNQLRALEEVSNAAIEVIVKRNNSWRTCPHRARSCIMC